jgi:hypothetical protein
MQLISNVPAPEIEVPLPVPPDSGMPDHIVVGADGVLLLGFLLWMFYKQILYKLVISRLQAAFRPAGQDERIKEILPQIAVLAGAHRVTFIGFHNGSTDATGYHLQKISTIHTYLVPGAPPMVKPIHNLPIDKIMYELAELYRSSNGWACITRSENQPIPCKAHLDTNFISKMHNKLLMVGNLPVGILSIQYTNNLVMHEATASDLGSPLMESLLFSLTSILQTRITEPGALIKILDKIKVFTGS